MPVMLVGSEFQATGACSTGGMVTTTCAVPGGTPSGWSVVVSVKVTVPVEASAADGV